MSQVSSLFSMKNHHWKEMTLKVLAFVTILQVDRFLVSDLAAAAAPSHKALSSKIAHNRYLDLFLNEFFFSLQTLKMTIFCGPSTTTTTRVTFVESMNELMVARARSFKKVLACKIWFEKTKLNGVDLIWFWWDLTQGEDFFFFKKMFTLSFENIHVLSSNSSLYDITIFFQF